VKIVDYVAIGGLVIGSGLLSTNTEWSRWGFVGLFIGSVASVMILKQTNAAKSVMWVNAYLALVNLIAIYRWFF
jgi:hypothetical protein